MSLSSPESEVFYEAQSGSGGAAANERASSPPERHALAGVQFPAITPSQASQHAARPHSTAPSTSSAAQKSRKRHSLPAPKTVPDVPPIPEHLLATGKRATLQQRRTEPLQDASKESAQRKPPSSPLSLTLQRPSTSHGAANLDSPRSPAFRTARSRHGAVDSNSPALPTPTDSTRRKSFSALPRQLHEGTLALLETGWPRSARPDMDRRRNKNEDLFLEIANDHGDNAALRPPSRSERAPSRLSLAAKRRSLPAGERSMSSSAENRPRTSGQIFGNRPSTRLDTMPSDLQRHAERYRNSPSRAGYQQDDAVSNSGLSNSGRRPRYSSFHERTPTSPARLGDNLKSSELPQYGRRRPSFGSTPTQAHKDKPSQLSAQQQDAFSESPAGSSDPKQSLPDSASIESDAADTVWDELDDLKSRIKKLELTGKVPLTSAAALSSEPERPRTATTAPTTINSSPKHDKPVTKPEPEEEPEDIVDTNTVGGPSVANIHPNLHSALAKAKPLLNHSLYRSLEATAADALQLVAITGSAGPQGTAFSAASIINGVTVSDRHVRRKADTMCRNLTDLCLALCDGKNDPQSATASPAVVSTPATSSPSLRHTRTSLGPNDEVPRATGRPMSRLEARRSSIFGNSRLGTSPARTEEASASEQESTPSNGRSTDLRSFHRSASRLQRIRSQLKSNEPPAEDDDPTIRPGSRAINYGDRAKPHGPREYATPHRSPSLRDSLTARRASAAASESGQQLSRVASMGSEANVRRRFLDPSTPPVLEEEREVDGDDYVSAPVSVQSQARRVMSLGRRRGVGEGLNRTANIIGRRGVAVE